MKFHLVILSVCVVQTCSGYYKDIGWTTTTEEINNQMKQEVREDISGVSERFIDDYIFIRNNRSNSNEAQSLSSLIDYIKIIQLNLSKNDVPPERYNGMVNLLFVLGNPNVTSEEIKNSLSYLYGTETTDTKITDLNIPVPTVTDCPEQIQRYTAAIVVLKSMVDIKSKVIEDSTTIREKFPCYDDSLKFLERFVYLMTQLQGDLSKITACAMERNLGQWEHHHSVLSTDPKGYESIKLDEIESILTVRLSDETFRGMLNFMKATKVGSTLGQIQKALEYLYGDAPTSATEFPR